MKTKIFTSSSLEVAESIVDTLTLQATRLQDSCKSYQNLLTNFEKVLNKHKVEFIELPSWLYNIKPTQEGKFEVWRIE